MTRIIPVDGREVARAAGLQVDLPVYARAAVEDDVLLAAWGLAWGGERCWLFFHVENYRPGHIFMIRREAGKCFRVARQMGETEVYTPRDMQHETSGRLCRVLGFEFFAVERGADGQDIEVWRWQDYR